MSYKVEITDTAFEMIRAQARYIAVECGAPLNAARWLEQVWDVVDGLGHMPGRHHLAAENEYKPYEVRRAVVGDYFLLFTVDEASETVWIIGFRHGARLPRPDDLPPTPPGTAGE